jgi:hypothetical protein
MCSTNQEEWHQLIKKYGEKKAKEIIVKKLRTFANQIESDKYPNIFSIHIDTEEDGFKDIMENISVTLSHPWPG